MTASWRAAIDVDGFVIVDDVLPPAARRAYLDVLDALPGDLRRDLASRVGLRDLTRRVPATLDLLRHASSSVRDVLGEDARLVRAILFDKTPRANWSVPWHQDVFVALRERVDVAGWTAWTVKDGVVHARPPLGVLERMLTVRIHLDDCTAADGPLRVVPGSHRHGLLDGDARAELLRRGPVVDAVARAGGALLMRPLLLHASGRAAAVLHRRVVHLEICAADLPAQLAWDVAVPLHGDGDGAPS